MSWVTAGVTRPARGLRWPRLSPDPPARGPEAALIVLALALAGAACTGQATGSSLAAPASSTSVTGTVTAAGKPLDSAKVTLYVGSSEGATPLGHAATGAGGRFSITYAAPASGVLYAAADGGAPGSLRLLAVVGVLAGGGVAPRTLSTVTVNELTTVATTFALAQFINGADISGPVRQPHFAS